MSAAAGPVAHADSANCDDLKRAALDPNWAAQQQQRVELRKGRPTTGLFFDAGPANYTALSSGTDELSGRAAKILDDAGISGVNPTHVETKIAAKMRDDGIVFGVLVINNGFVCGGPDAPGCRGALPVILPRGDTLYIWTKDARSVLIFKGRGS